MREGMRGEIPDSIDPIHLTGKGWQAMGTEGLQDGRDDMAIQ